MSTEEPSRTNNLLLTGRPGIGKSTIIRRVADRSRAERLGGFITEELRGPRGRLGFGLRTFDGRDHVLAHVDLRSRHRVGRYGVDVALLDDVAADALAAGRDLYLVDEIGKMECFSAVFVEAMEARLASDRPVVATIALRGGGFVERVKRRSDVEFWTVTTRNRDDLPAAVMAWLSDRAPA